MLGGCTSFVASAFITYFLGIWPFFAFQQVETWRGLLVPLAIGFSLSVVFGVVASRIAGLAGWFGSIGGSLAIGTFLYLNLGYVVRIDRPATAPPLEWPDWLPIVLPFGWIAIVSVIGYFTHKKDKPSL